MFWRTVNVKDPWAAVKKRDDSRRPVSMNNRDQVEFLEQFHQWLVDWETEAKKKPPKQTKKKSKLTKDAELFN